MALSFTEKDVDELIDSYSMEIVEDINWKLVKGLRQYKFSVPVTSSNNHKKLKLRLTGTKSILSQAYSFSLLINNRRVRGLDPIGHIHKSPPSNKITQNPHKHKFTDEYGTAYAYFAKDISTFTDTELTLREFLVECKISFIGKYTPPKPVQLPFRAGGFK